MDKENVDCPFVLNLRKVKNDLEFYSEPDFWNEVA